MADIRCLLPFLCSPHHSHYNMCCQCLRKRSVLLATWSSETVCMGSSKEEKKKLTTDDANTPKQVHFFFPPQPNISEIGNISKEAGTKKAYLILDHYLVTFPKDIQVLNISSRLSTGYTSTWHFILNLVSIKEDRYYTQFTVNPSVSFWAYTTVNSTEKVIGNAGSSVQTMAFWQVKDITNQRQNIFMK